MNYTKPEITSLASASFVIQSGTQKYDVINYTDMQGVIDRHTPPAYEGDE